MNIPANLLYTKDHEWISVDGAEGAIGITEFAQSELGDIVFVELPKVGDTLVAGKPFGTIEAVKAVSELFAPISGKVTAVNTALEADPMSINREPYGEGWMVKVALSSPISGLLTAAEYKELIS